MMEASNVEVDEVHRLANPWPITVGEALLRRQRLLLVWYPGLDHMFFADKHTCALPAVLQRPLLAHGSPTGQSKRLPPRLRQTEPTDKPCGRGICC